MDSWQPKGCLGSAQDLQQPERRLLWALYFYSQGFLRHLQPLLIRHDVGMRIPCCFNLSITLRMFQACGWMWPTSSHVHGVETGAPGKGLGL